MRAARHNIFLLLLLLSPLLLLLLPLLLVVLCGPTSSSSKGAHGRLTASARNRSDSSLGVSASTTLVHSGAARLPQGLHAGGVFTTQRLQAAVEAPGQDGEP